MTQAGSLFSRAFEKSQGWLESLKPDVLVVIYNDHVDQYFYDAWPTFSIGMAEQYDIPDEGLGRAGVSACSRP